MNISKIHTNNTVPNHSFVHKVLNPQTGTTKNLLKIILGNLSASEIKRPLLFLNYGHP